MSPTLDEAAAELYGVEPGRFTTERTRLAGAAREHGDAGAAKAIGELRRPTTSAWLVNQLVRGGAGTERLGRLGQDLRTAQAELDASRMRELTRQRHRLVGDLVRQADQVASAAGQKLSTAVRRELEDTLGAAVADEQAATAVLSGRLTRALVHTGFGEVDVTEATATPVGVTGPLTSGRRTTKLADAPRAGKEKQPAPSRRDGDRGRADPKSILPEQEPETTHRAGPSREDHPLENERQTPRRAPTPEPRRTEDEHPAPRPAEDEHPAPHRNKTTRPAPHRAAEAGRPTGTEPPASRRAEAERQVEQARAEADGSERELREKQQELDQVRAEQAERQARLERLQAEVVTVRRQLDAGDRRSSQVERDLKRQERRLKDATRQRDRAEAALAHLDPD